VEQPLFVSSSSVDRIDIADTVVSGTMAAILCQQQQQQQQQKQPTDDASNVSGAAQSTISSAYFHQLNYMRGDCWVRLGVVPPTTAAAVATVATTTPMTTAGTTTTDTTADNDTISTLKTALELKYILIWFQERVYHHRMGS
jgi:outer membrane protein W